MTAKTAPKTALKKATPAAPCKAPISKAHREDIAKISTLLKEAAIEHELCDEFYTVIEQINQKLTVPMEIDRKTKRRVAVVLDFRFELSDQTVEMSGDNCWHESTEEWDENEKMRLTAYLGDAIRKYPGLVLGTSSIEVDDFDILS